MPRTLYGSWSVVPSSLLLCALFSALSLLLPPPFLPSFPPSLSLSLGWQYVTPWFMCVFTSLPCWDAVMSLWDMLIFRGVKTIMRTGLAIMNVRCVTLAACCRPLAAAGLRSGRGVLAGALSCLPV